MPTDPEIWEKLKARLSGLSSTMARPATDKLAPKQTGFSASEVRKIARFIVDVHDGDATAAATYAEKFSQTCSDRMFGRAVVVAVERLTAKQEGK